MKPRSTVGVEMAVRVGDVGPGQAQYPRVTGERAVRELRQLPVVAGRQVVADLADLRVDEVIVVEQPFCGGHHRAFARQRPAPLPGRRRAATAALPSEAGVQ